MIAREQKVLRRLLIVCALLPPLLIATLGYFSRESQSGLQTAIGWVSHTLEVMAQIQSLGREVAQAESSQRSFLLTTNAVHLQAFSGAVTNIHSQTRTLRALT